MVKLSRFFRHRLFIIYILVGCSSFSFLSADEYNIIPYPQQLGDALYITCIDSSLIIGSVFSNTFIDQSMGGYRPYLVRSVDNGINWSVIQLPTSATNNTGFYQIKMLNKTIGFARNYYFIYKTMDGGLTWTKIQQPDSLRKYSIFSFDIYDEKNIFILTQDTISDTTHRTSDTSTWHLMKRKI